MKNTFKTFILLAGLTALLLAVGTAIGGKSGLMLALVFAGVMNFAGYRFSDKIALSMNGAQALSSSRFLPDGTRVVPASQCASTAALCDFQSNA